MVGQNAMLKTVARDETEMDPFSAELLRQQAIYEQVYRLFLTGQFPVPPFFKMYTPPVRLDFFSLTDFYLFPVREHRLLVAIVNILSLQACVGLATIDVQPLIAVMMTHEVLTLTYYLT